MLTQLQKQNLLILDELGYVPFSKAGSELLFEVVSRDGLGYTEIRRYIFAPPFICLLIIMHYYDNIKVLTHYYAKIGSYNKLNSFDEIKYDAVRGFVFQNEDRKRVYRHEFDEWERSSCQRSL